MMNFGILHRGWCYHSAFPISLKSSYGDGGLCSWCSLLGQVGNKGFVIKKSELYDLICLAIHQGASTEEVDYCFN